MKLKGIKLEGTYKVIYYDTYFKVYNKKGNVIYFEECNGYWAKWEYDKKGDMICFESSNGYWAKWENDKKGNMIYYKNSEGIIIDERVSMEIGRNYKELTIEEIEKLLGYKIKIKGA